MFIAVVVAVAALLQAVAAVLAVRVLTVTGRWPGWLLIIAVVLLMGARRCIVLGRIIAGDPTYIPDPVGELDALAASMLMVLGMSQVGPYFASLQESKERLQNCSRNLARRVAELNCLYTLSTLLEEKGDALDEIFPAVPPLIVESMQSPASAAARLTVGNQVHQAGKWPENPSKLECEITVDGQVAGRIEVCYPEPGGCDQTAFSDTERNLLSTIAQRLGEAVERVRTGQASAALRDQLHQAQKMEAVGQLAAGFAHDFNNLLTIIRGQLEQASKLLDASTPPGQAVSLARQTAAQASELTSSLMAFSRKVPTDKRPVDLGSIVRESCCLLRHSLPSSISLEVDLDPAQPLWIHADRTQVQQVILTLAINAQDAMPSGGTLRVAAFQAATTDEQDASAPVVRLVVADTGVGMSPEVKAHIFEPFFTTKPRGRGTGLGLAIVHSIVDEHGGRIAVESTPGIGSTFVVDFPALAGLRENQQEVRPTIPRHGRGELVLLGESDDHVRALMAGTLESLGYQVLQASDGTGVIDQAARREGQIHLLILDADLPGRGGTECLRVVRAAGLRAPVLLITAAEGVDLPVADLRATVLRKPFDMLELAAAVSDVLACGRAEVSEP